jgi:hypothetical protein
MLVRFYFMVQHIKYKSLLLEVEISGFLDYPFITVTVLLNRRSIYKKRSSQNVQFHDMDLLYLISRSEVKLDVGSDIHVLSCGVQ